MTTEHDEQAAFCEWMLMQHPEVLFYSHPNGAWLAGNKGQRIGQVNKLKREGMLPGVSDLFIAEPRGEFHGMYLEMKRPGGEVSENQLWFLDQAEQRGYFTAVAANGFDDAKSSTEWYLSLPRS